MNAFVSQATASLGAYASMFNVWTIISIIGIYPLYNIIVYTMMYIFDYKYIHISSYGFISTISPLIHYNTLTTSTGGKIGYIISEDGQLFGYIYINGHDFGGYVYISNKLITQYKLLHFNEDRVMTKYDDDKQYCTIFNYASNQIASEDTVVSYIHWNKTPTTIQSMVIEQIESTLKENPENNTCVVLLTGAPGIGKSMLCRLLAQKLNASLCEDYNPCSPKATTFTDLIQTHIQPTAAAPTVLVFEEVDVIIKQIHDGLIAPHPEFNIPVRNKTDWNNFLDRIDYGQYPNVILVMTTNKPRAWFDALDPSYMREGRVNLHIDIDAVASEMNNCDIPNKDKEE